jgi:hypothetical protein
MILRTTILRLRALNKGFTLVRSKKAGSSGPDDAYWLVPLAGSKPVSEEAMTIDEVREFLRNDGEVGPD